LIGAVRMCVYHLRIRWDVGCAFWVVEPSLTCAGGACQGVWWGQAPVWVPPLTAAAMRWTTMTMSLSSMARATILLARVVSGRRWRWMPTWLLPVRCLYHSFPSSIFLLLPFFPTSHPFLPISLLWAHIERVRDPAFGFTQGRWWWWVGWTNQHQSVMGQWRCGTRWGGTSDPLICGIRGCGGGVKQGGGGQRTR
jgi:hypothetical protein